MHDRFKRLSLVALACALTLGSGSAVSAQQSITVVVPFAAGGTSDISMRAIASTVEESGGPRITIENRRAAVAFRPPSRSRMRRPTGRRCSWPTTRPSSSTRRWRRTFRSTRPIDFRPITTLFTFPLMLAIPTGVDAKSVPELVALAKKKPGGLSYGSQGVGTAGHLLGELFAKASGAPLVHVPYKGAAQGVIDLVAGASGHDVHRHHADQAASRMRQAASRWP